MTGLAAFRAGIFQDASQRNPADSAEQVFFLYDLLIVLVQLNQVVVLGQVFADRQLAKVKKWLEDKIGAPVEG